MSIDKCGWIGLICPGVAPAAEIDFHRFAPHGLAISTLRIPYREVSLEGLEEMSCQAKEMAKMFRGFPIELLVFACTTGSMVKGWEYDKILMEEMEKASGIPAITTSTAILEAFDVLGAKDICIVTPYDHALNELEVDFLKKGGYNTTSITGFGHTDPKLLPFTNPEDVMELAIQQDMASADVLFISCTALRVMETILPLEEKLGIPVITSNQATLWSALKRIGVEQMPRLGKLFEK